MIAKPKFRNRLLMPWTWSRWTWAMLFPVLIGIYFFSAVPFYLLGYEVVERHPGFRTTYHITLHKVFLPVWYCAKQSPVANSVLGWQFHQIHNRHGDYPEGGVFGIDTLCGVTEIKFPPGRPPIER